MKVITLFAAILALSACSNQPKLYSPVIPFEGGVHKTEPTARTKAKAVIRATRNAQRYCEHKGFGGYATLTIETNYQGLIDDQKTSEKIDQVTGLAHLPNISGSEYKTELAFKCQ